MWYKNISLDHDDEYGIFYFKNFLQDIHISF